MSLEDFIERELENIERDLVKPENWGDDNIRNYLLGWKEALQEVLVKKVGLLWFMR